AGGGRGRRPGRDRGPAGRSRRPPGTGGVNFRKDGSYQNDERRGSARRVASPSQTAPGGGAGSAVPVENNHLMLFAPGLVFFALGFAVWIQRRRATRLTLTSSLIWLAGFAFVESLAVWGYVFVPIQDSYAGHGVIDVLIVLRALLQTTAFLFLLAFG